MEKFKFENKLCGENMVEINPAITNDYTHWIRNTGVDDAEKIIKFLKSSKEWKDFKILPGTLRVEQKLGIYENCWDI